MFLQPTALIPLPLGRGCHTFILRIFPCLSLHWLPGSFVPALYLLQVNSFSRGEYLHLNGNIRRCFPHLFLIPPLLVFDKETQRNARRFLYPKGLCPFRTPETRRFLVAVVGLLCLNSPLSDGVSETLGNKVSGVPKGRFPLSTLKIPRPLGRLGFLFPHLKYKKIKKMFRSSLLFCHLSRPPSQYPDEDQINDWNHYY